MRKSVPGEVLVTDWGEIDGKDQRVTVGWPSGHSFYVQGDNYSPLLFVESLRQALALLSHHVHRVPLGHRLGWEHIRCTVNRQALRADGRAADVVLRISHPSVRRRRLGSVQLTSRIEAQRAGAHLGTAELDYTAHPPALYDRLRGSHRDAAQAVARALPPAPPVPAAGAGREHERDVLLSPTGTPGTWRLRVDTGHRVFFDHPHDHVPGMVLLEAASQAARALADHPVTPVAFDARFLRYVELDRPCLVTAEPGPPGDPRGPQAHVTATQDGEPVFSSVVIAARRS
ncbi:ScbA/BarX family gamma-butyrolactone biosynthesis protein [Streptomyces sp. NPDC005876]|uniref:ScbA/BarX family gamma-butyrolactone biosynthesis protein n=1 Tax=unclassified Streptomyces TaxID=2593676 RepID=UPI0033EB4ACD